MANKATRAGALVLLILAGCTANGGFGGDSGGVNPGEGDGGGGDCLLVVDGVCVIGGPSTGLPNHTCTQVAFPGSTLVVTESGPLCELTDALSAALNTCDVLEPSRTLDGDYDSAARVQYVAGAVDPLLGGAIAVSVSLPRTVDAGRAAAFLVQYPGGLVDASVIRGLTVTTFLGGVQQETATFDTLLDVDVLGLIGASEKVLVGFPNTQPYDSLSLTVDALVATVDVFDAVDVFEACLNAAPNS